MTAIEDTSYQPLVMAVFTKPGEAIDRILASQSRHFVLPLAMLGGIAFNVGVLLNTGLFFVFVNWRAMLFTAVFGAVVGIVGVYLVAPIFCWIGRFIDGHASPFELRAAWAWSFLPSLFGFVVVVTALLIAGILDPDRFMVPAPLLLWMKLITGVSRIWGMIVFVVMVSRVHRFTMWWAIMTYVAGMASVAGIAIFVRSILGYLLNIPPALFNIREYVLHWIP